MAYNGLIVVNGGTAVRGRRGFAVGMAAGEAGRRRYSHKEVTQELTQNCNKELLCKSYYKVIEPKGGLLEESKKYDLVPKGVFYDRK